MLLANCHPLLFVFLSPFFFLCVYIFVLIVNYALGNRTEVDKFDWSLWCFVLGRMNSINYIRLKNE